MTAVCCSKTLVEVWLVIIPAGSAVEAATMGVGGGMVRT